MTALDGTQFSPEVTGRLSSYPKTLYKNVTEDSPLLEPFHVPPFQINTPQAVPLVGSKEEGYSHVYRNKNCVDRLITTYHPTITTVPESFDAVANAFPDAECWGERKFNASTNTWGEFVYESYGVAQARKLAFGKGLADVVQEVTGLDARVKPYCVGLYGPNSVSWILADTAAQTQSLPTVCLYDTLGPEATEYILNLTEAPVVVAAIPLIPSLLKSAASFPNLKVIIAMTPFGADTVYDRPGTSTQQTLTAWAESVGVKLLYLPQVEKIGEASSRAPNYPHPSDTLTINFTSGTTGNPKGVIISHANIVASLSSTRQSSTLYRAGEAGFMSFLPLAHIYERINVHTSLSTKVRVGFYHGDVTGLLDDFAAARPGLILGVPRVWNRISSSLRAATLEAEGITGALSRRAFAAKLAKLHETGSYTHPIWDRLWSNKIRAKIGFENTKVLATGSAPMATENIEFLKCVLAVEFIQGYGLTETMGGVSSCAPGDNHHGSVGPVNFASEVRLRDLPDYNYLSTDKPYPRGEIMMRGPQIFMGYYKNEEATKNSIQPEGWFHTGDVGMIDDMGRLHIIDRVKNFFKLAQGEYVGPERIEALYTSSSSLIGQIFVEGNSLETYVVAVVGVNPEVYVQFLAHHFNLHYEPTDLHKIHETFERRDVRLAFLKELNHHARHAQLKGYEKIKNVTLRFEPFNADNGTMTPTLKVKRLEAARFIKPDVDAMYKEGPLDDSAKI